MAPARSSTSSTAASPPGCGRTPKTKEADMRHWDLREMPIEVHRPEVLQSDGEGRAIAINLPAGERLQEHEVHERAWLLVADGRIEIELPNGGDQIEGGPGLLA